MSVPRSVSPLPSDPESVTSPRLDRRTLFGLAAGGSAALTLGRSLTPTRSAAAADTGSRAWRTWILKSADELRPDAPGDPAQSEIDEILALQASRSYGNLNSVSQWGTHAAVVPWAKMGIAAAGDAKLSGIRDMRVQAILRAAMYDAVLAAYDAQAAYPRRAPALADSKSLPM